MQKVAIVGGIAAIAVAIGIAVALSPTFVVDDFDDSSFPVRVDFARVLPYENLTAYPNISRGHIMDVRVLYSEDGPPRPYFLLLSPQRNVWGQVTDPQEWIRQGTHGNHGFQVLSSSMDFDRFTEYFPSDSSIIPQEMRIYCPECEQKWSRPYPVQQSVDPMITRIAILVHPDPDGYEVVFALRNNQIDSLPASGIVNFRMTDSIGVTLYETRFRVIDTDFRFNVDDPIRLLRVPMGGKAAYVFTIPIEDVRLSPTGKTTGFAFLDFTLEDGRTVSGGIDGVRLPIR